ncbi:hypothetical protein JCM11491_007139 [Sporobolomyces phaffii]
MPSLALPAPTTDLVPPGVSSTRTNPPIQQLHEALAAFTLDSAPSEVFLGDQPLAYTSASLNQLFSALANRDLPSDRLLGCLEEVVSRAKRGGSLVAFPPEARISSGGTSPRPGSASRVSSRHSSLPSQLAFEIEGPDNQRLHLSIGMNEDGSVEVVGSAGGEEVVMRSASQGGSDQDREKEEASETAARMETDSDRIEIEVVTDTAGRAAGEDDKESDDSELSIKDVIARHFSSAEATTRDPIVGGSQARAASARQSAAAKPRPVVSRSVVPPVVARAPQLPSAVQAPPAPIASGSGQVAPPGPSSNTPRRRIPLPTPISARLRVESYVARNASAPLPPLVVTKRRVLRADINESSITEWPRPSPSDGDREDIAAALVVYPDYLLVQNSESSTTLKFEPSLSSLLSAAEKTSSAVEATIEDLVSVASFILARNCTLYSCMGPGVDNDLAAKMSVGPRLDFDLARQALEPAEAEILRILPEIQDYFQGRRARQHREAFQKAAPTSLQQAVNSVIVHESHRAVWHPDQPRPRRSYDDIKAHPSFAPVLAFLDGSIKNALEQLELRDPRAEVTRVEVDLERSPSLAKLLHQAFKETQVPIHGRAAVTFGLSLGEEGKANSGSVWRHCWYPFLREYQKKDVPRIREEVRSNPPSDQALDDFFRFHGYLSGILAFSGSRHRTGANKVALSDGRDLAATQALFEAATQASMVPPLPTLHKTISGCSVKVDFPTPDTHFEDEAIIMISDIYDEVVRRVVKFGQEEFVPPIENFDMFGHLPFKQPATKSKWNVGGIETKNVSHHLLRSDDGVVALGFEYENNPALDVSLLDLEGLHLDPDEPPRAGESVIEATRRRGYCDTTMPCDPELRRHFAYIVDRLDEASRNLHVSQGFGQKIHGKTALTSIFLMRDALNIIHDEGLVGREDLQALWEFSLLSIAL